MHSSEEEQPGGNRRQVAPEAAVQLLRRVGAALYGDRWQSALALDLSVTDRTMRRWVSGDSPVPGPIWGEVRVIVARRGAVLGELYVALDPAALDAMLHLS